MDFDPSNISHHKIFLCLQDRRKFEPKLTIEPIFQEYTIPAEYSVSNGCSFVIDKFLISFSSFLHLLGLA